MTLDQLEAMIGENERDAGVVQLKNLKNKDQKNINVESEEIIDVAVIQGLSATTLKSYEVP
jgi:histidyl-tRNA synthetase